jgi:hypothetical protein
MRCSNQREAIGINIPFSQLGRKVISGGARGDEGGRPGQYAGSYTVQRP